MTNKPRPPISLPPRSPIAHRTRSRTNAPLALFTSCHPYHKGVSYHIPTAKSTRAPEKHLGFVGLCHAFAMSPKETKCFAFLCEALVQVDGPYALAILDPATGKFLEHHQLCQDPCYKTTWDTSYANKLGQLCQGIGSDFAPTGQ